MHISCPKCHFKRNVDRKQIPASAITATCPKCENKFRFRDPETGDFLDEICSVFEDTSLDASVEPSRQTTTPASAASSPANESAKIELAKKDSSLNIDDNGKEQSTISHSETAHIANVSAQGVSQDDNTQKVDEQQVDANIDSDEFYQNDGNHEDPKPLKEEDIVNQYKNEDRNNSIYNTQNDFSSSDDRDDKYQMITDDVPWEHPERYGIIGSLFQTIARVMFRAPAFFSTIHSQSSALRPISFYALLGLFQVLCLRIWLSTFENIDVLLENPGMQESISHFSTPMTLIMTPFLSIFQLLLFSAFLYLAIRITNPEHANYNLILRIVAYAYAPTILSIVPYVGPLIGLIWFIANIFIGIKYALRLTWQRTALALSPIFLLWLFIIVNSFSRFM